MKRFWWWVLGGAGALIALSARAQKKAIVDRLVVVITFKPGYQMTESVMQDIARVVVASQSACPGLPPIGELKELGAGQTESGNRTVRAVYDATYSHDQTGPIRTEVASCLLAQLKKTNGNVLALYAARPDAEAGMSEVRLSQHAVSISARELQEMIAAAGGVIRVDGVWGAQSYQALLDYVRRVEGVREKESDMKKVIVPFANGRQVIVATQVLEALARRIAPDDV